MAHLLLAREICNLTGEQETSAGLVVATNGVLLRLHERLAQWLGRDGAYAVFARALDRTRAQHPMLVEARIDPHGEHPLEVPAENVRDRDPAEIRETLAALIAAVLALLTRLIGADLVARLLGQVWPDETFDVERPAGPPAVPDEIPTAARAGDTNTMRMPDEDAPSD